MISAVAFVSGSAIVVLAVSQDTLIFLVFHEPTFRGSLNSASAKGSISPQRLC